MASRGDDQSDEPIAQSRDAEDRWTAMPRMAEGPTEGVKGAAEAPGPAREAERAGRARQHELAAVVQSVREEAEKAQEAHLAEERAAQAEHGRKLEELSAMQELARELEIRRVRLTLESARLQEIAREAAETAAAAQEEVGAARDKRSQKLREARAAHEALVAADARSTQAIERANRIAASVGEAFRRTQEIREEEKGLVARMERTSAEVRRAETQRISAHARRGRIAAEVQELLRRIEASRDLETIPEDRIFHAPNPSPNEGRTAASADRREGPSDSNDLTVREMANWSPPQLTESWVAAAPHLSVRGTRSAVRVILVVAASLLASLIAFSLWRSFGAREVEGSSRSGSVGESAPDEDAPAGGRPVVPNVAGLSIVGARDRLLQTGLKLDQVLPTPGPPGIVVRAEPSSGRVVRTGAAVTLYVGVNQGRLEEESRRSRSNPSGS